MRVLFIVGAVAYGSVSMRGAQQSPASPVLVDPDMSVAAGATISAAVGEAIARAEDAFVPVRVLPERGVARRAANIAYRLLKLTYFDLPQEQWIVVANHEVFGHGARLRERFDGPIRYRVDAPVPYGDGGGSTSFGFDREPTSAELLALSAAGMEADAVAASTIAHLGFSSGRMRARDAMRYLGFELDTLGYVLSTGDGPEDPGHDVADFIEKYNAVVGPGGATITARQLRREVLVGLANPMIAYAAFAIVHHLATGADGGPVPALSIAGMRYLPMARYRLAPYGTEWSVLNAFAPASNSSSAIGSLQLEVRAGRSPAGTPWGIGVQRRAIAGWREWRLDAVLDVWRQPELDGGAVDALRRGMLFGGEMRVRVERPVAPVWFSSTRATAIVEIGVKSSGFVAGEPLGSGVLVRAGVGLPFDR